MRTRSLIHTYITVKITLLNSGDLKTYNICQNLKVEFPRDYNSFLKVYVRKVKINFDETGTTIAQQIHYLHLKGNSVNVH